MPITFEQCSFSYRKGRPVISALNLEIPEGSTILLGPNGAGKSTLLALASSLLNPTHGRVSYAGLSSRPRRHLRSYRQRIGWMPQKISAIPRFTVREQVAYAGWLKGQSRAEAWRQSLRALRDANLEQLAQRRVSELSGGQLRRVGLAQTLVHGAEVVLMDEPTAGLDPNQVRRFMTLISSLRDRVHIVVSTHQIEDVESAYSSLILFDKGRCRFVGTIDDFRAGSAKGKSRSLSAAYARMVEQED